LLCGPITVETRTKGSCKTKELANTSQDPCWSLIEEKFVTNPCINPDCRVLKSTDTPNTFLPENCIFRGLGFMFLVSCQIFLCKGLNQPPGAPCWWEEANYKFVDGAIWSLLRRSKCVSCQMSF